jgi:nucleoid DNA-binding protein
MKATGGITMEESFTALPGAVQEHLKSILPSSGLPDTDESLAALAEVWVKKRDMFSRQVRSLDMIDADRYAVSEQGAALMLTYSGSLVSLGTAPDNGVRWVEYASIKLRKDVPDILKEASVKLADEVRKNGPVRFEEGPIKSTSAVHTIAVFPADVPLAEQETRIREATIFLTNGFIKLNRTLSVAEEGLPEQFTLKTIVSSLAKRHGLTQKQTRELVEDYLLMLESGILLGESASLGRLGRIRLHLRPAQKARVGRNPATGEELTIKAKPAVYVPKATFSKHLKDKAESVETPTQDDA